MADTNEEMDAAVDVTDAASEDGLSDIAGEDSPKPRRRRRGFRSGIVFGIVAGLVASLVMRPKSAGEQVSADGPPADADGAIAGLRSRLREAAGEARDAAHEAEEAKRARFSELLERE